jgi:CheY-like chemotaxis protein
MRDLPVLVVDDNATNRRILHEMLTHWDMRPTTVESGLAALKILEQTRQAGARFPLVLLDAHMPEMDGFTVAERINQNPLLEGTTLLMLSSGDRREMEVRCRQVGVSNYLHKPITGSELWEAIVTALSRPEVQRERSHRLGGWHKLQDGAEMTQIRRLRILLAEDNIVNQRLVVRLLEKLGHATLVANTGREVLTALQQQRIDLVLMDIQMPEMDGLEATAAIREQERHEGGHLPIIALTAHAMKGDQERCLIAGMDDYVSKPINTQALSSAISRVLSGPTPLSPLAREPLASLAVATAAEA